MNIAASLGNTASRGITQATGGDIRSQQQKVTGATQGLDPEDPNSLLMVAQKLDSLGESARATVLRQMAAQKRAELNSAAKTTLDKEATTAYIKENYPELASIAHTLTVDQAVKMSEKSNQFAAAGDFLYNTSTGEARRLGEEEEEDDDTLNPLPLNQQSALMSQGRSRGLIGDSLTAFQEGLSSGVVQSISDIDEYLPETSKMEILPVAVQTIANDTSIAYRDGVRGAQRAEALVNNIISSAEYARQSSAGLLNTSGGIGRRIDETLKNLLGGQDALTAMREGSTREINTALVNSLPPGVASDKDIELVAAGFPNTSTASLSHIVAFLEAQARVYQASADYNYFKSSYMDAQIRNTGDPSLAGIPRASNRYYEQVARLRTKLEALDTLKQEEGADLESIASQRNLLKEQFKQFSAVLLTGNEFATSNDGILPPSLQ